MEAFYYSEEEFDENDFVDLDPSGRLYSLRPADIEALTGYTSSMLALTALEWDIPYESMIIVTMVIHMNLTFQQLSILLHGFGVVKSESSLNRLFHKVTAAAPSRCRRHHC